MKYFALAALALPAAALAGAYGIDTRMGSAQNMDGVTVPSVLITVDKGRRQLDRGQVQGAIARRLSGAGVRPDEIALQSVATAAMQFAQAQDAGRQDMCFETWCATVVVAGNGY